MQKMNKYTIESNINFCFWVEVEAESLHEAEKIAYDRSFSVAYEVDIDGYHPDISWSMSEPEIGVALDEDDEEIIED